MIEKIFRKISFFKNLKLDTILFEANYKVMFTCLNNDDIYLFICHFVDSKSMKWIGTKTSYFTLINLLKNQITIRSSFLGVTEKKFIIEYDGEKVIYCIVNKNDIDKSILPTDGMYMDSEPGEFDEEILQFLYRLSLSNIRERLLFGNKLLNNDICNEYWNKIYNKMFSDLCAREYKIISTELTSIRQSLVKYYKINSINKGMQYFHINKGMQCFHINKGMQCFQQSYWEDVIKETHFQQISCENISKIDTKDPNINIRFYYPSIR